MDFATIIYQFISIYFELLIPLFALGLASFVSRTYSMMFMIFSIMCFALYFIISSQTIGAIAIAALVISFVLKLVGL